MLSKRLLKIAELIDENKVVYDVGTDHGLLPCFLVLNKNCPKVYACDNKIGPLNKAKANIEKYELEGKVIPVLSSGIDDIKDDVNIITTAGMGFFSVKDIFEGKDLSKYDKIIVQVNKDTNLLRKWISDHNYSIIDECIVYDDFYYEIVVFNANKGPKLSDLELKYGPINLRDKTDTFKEYLAYIGLKLASINKNAHKQEYENTINEINDIIS